MREAALLVAAALAAACPRPDGGREDTTSSSEATIVGVVVAVLNQQTLIDGVRAAGGDGIPAGAVVSTDPNGAARLSLEGSTDCEIRPDSAVEVQPLPGLVMRLTRGTTVCDREEGTSTATLEAGGTRVDLGDATLALELPAGDEGLELRSYRGEVEVWPSPGQKLLLRPREELAVSTDGVDGEPTRWEPEALDPSERRAVERVQSKGLSTSTTSTSTTGTTALDTTTTTSASSPSFTTQPKVNDSPG